MTDADRGEDLDTGEREFPPIHDAGDRAMLTGLLDWYRRGVVLKLDGLSSEAWSSSPVRSSTTIAGLVKHLAAVEDAWFTERFAGRPSPEPWASAPWDHDPDWEFHTAPHEPVEVVVSMYEAACDRSRAVTDAAELDDLAANYDRPFTLRFALVHLLEETARHLGHIDILRELADGRTGE
ncbi:MAG TPA: DinB family protein [Microthrixaceae bacterium]|nr:DinB family protein [Microthrixaceae bacterium]